MSSLREQGQVLDRWTLDVTVLCSNSIDDDTVLRNAMKILPACIAQSIHVLTLSPWSGPAASSAKSVS